MFTSVALASRLLRWGVCCVLTCTLAFYFLEVGIALVSGGVAQALASKKRVVKKRGKTRPGLVKRLKGKRTGHEKFPPLRDAHSTALAAQASPMPAAPPVVTPHKGTPQPPPNTTLQAQKGHPKGNPKGKGKPLPPTDDEIMDDAQNAYVRGERQRAIDLALGVAEKGGAMAESAWRFIGLAACSVRSHRMATRAFQNLRAPKDQRSITSACKLNGVAYRDEQFVRE
jgi:hypothetical protein